MPSFACLVDFPRQPPRVMSSSYLTTDPQPPTGIQLLDLPMLRRKFGHSHYAVLADQEVHSYILYGWKNGKWTQVGSITGFCVGFSRCS